MSIVMQINPFEFFVDAGGDALDGGYIWIGQPNLDPRAFPVAIYYDKAMTIPAPMPLRTSNGYVIRNGSPTFLFVDGNYSVLVEDKRRRQVYYVADFLLVGSGAAVAEDDLANSTDPLKGIGMIGAYGETLRAVLDRTYARFIFSKIKADGNSIGTIGTDDTAVLQSELDTLKSGDYYITPPGYSIITHVICPTVDGITFRFTGTKFILKAGHDPLDNEMFRWNSLRNSDVYDFYTDGNVANVPDTSTGSDERYGRVLNWRLGNNSINVRFYRLTMVNCQYCGSQWGNNIQNITMDGITYDNVGEHVFYISGTGGGANTRLTWKNVTGGSFGLNPRNTVGNHECAFLKSFQTVGFNDNWIIDGIRCGQESPAAQAATVVINQDLLNLTINNISIGDNIGSVFYPIGRADYVTIDGLRKIGAGTAPQLIHSHVGGVSIKRWVCRNLDFTNSFEIGHIQMFDLIENSIMPRFGTSATPVGEFATGRVVRFRNVRFDRIGYLRHVEHDIEFQGCSFRSTETGSNGAVEFIGLDAYTAGKWVIFEDCRFVGAHDYTLSTQNNAARLRLARCWGPLKRINARASSTMTKLVVDDVEVTDSVNIVTGLTVDSRKLRLLVQEDGTRDWARYTSTWTIATGQSSIGFNLVAVLATPFTLNDVDIVPITAPSASGITSFHASISGTTLTITSNAAASVPLQFAVTVAVP